MADLRLVGVHDDGGHLLLSGPDGNNYLLPLDEALRTAVGKTPHRSTRTAQPSGTRMSPREIQSMIRAGSNAAEVVEQSGLSLEQVRRYEGPVLAEREYIASQARKVQVGTESPHTEGYKSAFGNSAATLEEMVRHRLTAFGIDTKSLRWDAWREHAGAWTISATFEPGTHWAANSIGEAPPALWRFHASRKDLHNANRWAQQLSELEPLDSPVPERRLSAVIDKPFDVEADTAGEIPNEAAADEQRSGDGEQASAHEAPEEDQFPGRGILDMLRSRRGVRLGLDEDGDDELAAMLGTHVPGAHPRDESLYGAGSEETETEENAANEEHSDAEPAGPQKSAGARDRLRGIPFLKLAPRLADHDEHHLDTVGSVSEVSSETREVVLSGEPLTATPAAPSTARPVTEPAPEPDSDSSGSNNPNTDSSNPHDDDGPSDSEVAERLERKAAAKPKRSSVPSWDEIVFGTKGD
ncbi:septation protein SepH [Arthrobacter antibioticus]|uniref:septation protein SepH n=1 Tax=Arthrobacter sp. H35-MC1 TaxID=3046203 RepID=UPI0024BB68EC|nr:septation protein SepH [Arthrobacter sp. H35-MC1]MDJ0318111.1 septation protein SepH [Arthrobacter sp. H35-MC1]